MTRTCDLITMEEARQKAALSPAQAGHLLGLGTNATYRAIQRGEIFSLRLGAKIVIPVPALLAMLEQKP